MSGVRRERDRRVTQRPGESVRGPPPGVVHLAVADVLLAVPGRLVEEAQISGVPVAVPAGQDRGEVVRSEPHPDLLGQLAARRLQR
jgi:hypothetical protein